MWVRYVGHVNPLWFWGDVEPPLPVKIPSTPYRIVCRLCGAWPGHGAELRKIKGLDWWICKSGHTRAERRSLTLADNDTTSRTLVKEKPQHVHCP
jgi:hypothetical protein